ncbi:MAG: phosphoribosylformylglycinamidine synthase subunit PurS [Bacteroidales bacterium]|nr:phosphoribosylformylglycinamidine synthase subunit PurS [Bacteroidales bacterium]
MKKFIANIRIMPLKNLDDPQGKAVKNALSTHFGLLFKTISSVRIGKNITVDFEADSEEKAKEIIEEMCKKLLRNPVVEYYEYEIKKM